MKKKNIFILSLFLILISINSSAQIDILKNKFGKKIKDGINKTVSGNKISDFFDDSSPYFKKGFKERWKTTLTKFSESYDVTDFNYAISFGDNSPSHESKGNLKQAKSFAYYLADPENTKNPPPKVKGQNFNYTGEILYASNSYRLSEKNFLKALEVYKRARLEDSTFAVLTISNLGLLYHATGRYALAEEYTKTALLKRETNSNKTGYAASLNNIAVLYKDMGLYTQAEEYILKAENFLKKEKDNKSVEYAIVLNNKAMIFQEIGRFRDAESIMMKSLEIAKTETRKKSATFIRLKVNLALLYQMQKRYNEAEKIYLDAIKVKKKRLGTSHPDYAVLLQNIASLYQEMEKYDKVEKYLKDAVSIYEKKFGKQHPSYATSIYELGVYYQSRDKLQEAKPLLYEALKIQKSTLGEHHPDITSTNENIAVLEWQNNNFSDAANKYRSVLSEYIYQINTYFPAMNDYEKSKFWEKIHPKFIRFYNFSSEAFKSNPEISGDVYNFHIATKALLLNSSRKVKNRILNSGDNNLITKYNNWQDSKSYLAKLYTYTNNELNEENINLDSLETHVKELEKDLSKSSEIFKESNEQKNITYSQIASKLKPNEAAIEFIRINNFYYLYAQKKVHYIALILKNNSEPPSLVYFKNGDEMESEYSDEYQEAIHSGKNMSKFNDYYWNEIGNHTKDAGTIYTSVDGIYNKVNINTILLPSGKHIIEEKNILFVTNTKDILNIEEKVNIAQKSAFLLGFPDYLMDLPKKYSYLAPLPGTEKEIKTIKSLLIKNSWKVKTLLARDATEERIKEVKNPYVFHIATHGFFAEKTTNLAEGSRAFGIEPLRASENPLLRSGLLLAGADKTVQAINTKDNKESDDGILNAFEAMILDLDDTELVILSACQTGLGEIKSGEGVYGLQRSFQIAGASSVITSLWEVSDEGTQDLMSNFYKNWLQSGDKHDAFHKAQLSIKEKYKYPFYWGAFVLVGK